MHVRCYAFSSVVMCWFVGGLSDGTWVFLTHSNEKRLETEREKERKRIRN